MWTFKKDGKLATGTSLGLDSTVTITVDINAFYGALDQIVARHQSFYHNIHSWFYNDRTDPSQMPFGLQFLQSYQDRVYWATN
jgi:hypothetical protein